MQRILGYIIASMVSTIGWKLGTLVDPVFGFFVAVVFAGAGLFLARRWLRTVLD